MAEIARIIDALKQRFQVVETGEFRGLRHVTLTRAEIHDALAYLKQDHGFDMLVDVTCIDYLTYREATDRFVVIYHLDNAQEHQRLVVRVALAEADLRIPSVTDLWAGANWLEREVWDMFGIHFDGHPDLRRILLPPEFTAHPLRKDYPRQGLGERHNFPVITRDQS